MEVTLDILIHGIDGADVGKEIGSGTMTDNIKNLIHMLRDEDNCNVLDYIDEAADCIEEQAHAIDDLMFENENKQRRINELVAELNKYEILAESRLKRKNMYKERSERSLFEKERYRLDLEQVKRERDALIEERHGECEYCKYDHKMRDICFDCLHNKYRVIWKTGKEYPDNWEWRGTQETE